MSENNNDQPSRSLIKHQHRTSSFLTLAGVLIVVISVIYSDLLRILIQKTNGDSNYSHFLNNILGYIAWTSFVVLLLLIVVVVAMHIIPAVYYFHEFRHKEESIKAAVDFLKKVGNISKKLEIKRDDLFILLEEFEDLKLIKTIRKDSTDLTVTIYSGKFKENLPFWSIFRPSISEEFECSWTYQNGCEMPTRINRLDPNKIQPLIRKGIGMSWCLIVFLIVFGLALLFELCCQLYELKNIYLAVGYGAFMIVSSLSAYIFFRKEAKKYRS